MQPSQLQQAIQNKMAMQQQNIAAQRQQIEQMRNAPQELDLSALMGLTDAWTGSNFMRSYQRPETKQERAYKASQMEQGLQRQEMGLIDDEIKLLSLLDRKQTAKQKAAEKAQAKDKPKELTQNMIKTLNEGNAIPGMLSNLGSVIEENKDVFGPLVGRFRSMNPYDEDAKKIDAEMRAKSQAFGKFMEGGVLRKEDEEKYRKMFPQLSDTPETAADKLAIVQDLLEKKQSSDIEAFQAQGFDTTGLTMKRAQRSSALDDQSKSRLEELRAKMKGR